MPRSTLSPIPQTYAQLRHAVEVAMIQGQRAVDLARVRTYHDTGRLIREHVLLNSDRADYGAKTVQRLGADLKLERSVLYRCMQFAEAFPIVATSRQLTWAHYCVLLPIADPKLRHSFAIAADRHGWSAAKLAERIRPLHLTENASPGESPSAGAPQPPLTPLRGALGIARLASVGDALVVDLGFACFFDLPGAPAPALKAGSLVTIDRTGRITAAAGATKADLFNYRVELLRVVDGDTLWVKIYLRPRQWVKQKLRLRGLDAPELVTAEGKAAKRFVEALVAATQSVTIHTTKPDKYDRYLADVYLTTSTGEIFLNNELLARGHAVRKDSWEFSDWEKDLVH